MKTISKLNKFYSINELNSSNLNELLSYKKENGYEVLTKEEMLGGGGDTAFDATTGATYRATILLLDYYNSGHKEVENDLKEALSLTIKNSCQYHGYNSEIDAELLIMKLMKKDALRIIDDKKRFCHLVIDCIINNKSKELNDELYKQLNTFILNTK